MSGALRRREPVEIHDSDLIGVDLRSRNDAPRVEIHNSDSIGVDAAVTHAARSRLARVVEIHDPDFIRVDFY